MKEKVMQMDCAQFDDVLHELDRPGTYGAALCEAALAHAESCSRCADLLTQAEWLDFNLSKLVEAAADRQAPSRVETALLKEFGRVKRASSHRIRLQFAALGAAAVLFMALGLSLRHGAPFLESPRTNGTDLAATRIKQPAPALPPLAGSAAIVPSVTPEAPRGVRTARNRAVEAVQPAEYATGFVAVPYADDSTADEGGAIVRVELPRAALASFGLPVIDAGGAERVQADFIVSADGTPQAVRLVSQVTPRREF